MISAPLVPVLDPQLRRYVEFGDSTTKYNAVPIKVAQFSAEAEKYVPIYEDRTGLSVGKG